MTNFRLFQTERVCRRQFQLWWKWQTVLQKGRKHCGKRRNCTLRAISPFPTVFSKDLYCRRVKTRACLGKGWNMRLCGKWFIGNGSMMKLKGVSSLTHDSNEYFDIRGQCCIPVPTNISLVLQNKCVLGYTGISQSVCMSVCMCVCLCTKYICS